MSCETDTGLVQYMETPVAEGATAVLTGYLTDESGADLALAELQTLTLTLTDQASGNILNSRNAVDVKNANGGTVQEVSADVDGNSFVPPATRLRFRQVFSTTDNVILGADRSIESHAALFAWGYDTTKIGEVKILFSVQRL